MTIIRGPRDKAAFRNDPTEWTGYVDPLPACPLGAPFTEPRSSVSEIKKAWPKNLTDWAAREAARAAWKHRAALIDMDEDEALDLIAPASNRQRNRAASRGHEIHDLLERLLDGGTITVLDDASPAAAYVPVLNQLATDLQPEVVASEVVVFGSQWAGTFDAVWRIEDRLVLVDYKSRKPGKAATRYPEEGVQLGAYAAAAYWIVEDDDGLRRMAPLDLDAGLIVSLAPDGYRLYDVDLEAATNAWAYTVAFRQTQQSAPQMFGRPRGVNVEAPGDLPGLAEWGRTEIAAEPDALGTAPGSAASDEPGRADVRAWIAARVSDLPPDARAALAAAWPADLPTLKAFDGHTAAQLDRIDELVKVVERDFELPFGDTDPRLVERDAQVVAERLAEPTPIATDPFDEGPDVEGEATGRLRAAVTMLPPETKALVESWAAEAHAAGRSISVAQRKSAWRVGVVQAALDLVAVTEDPNLIRTILGLAIGDEVQPATTIGAALTALTLQTAPIVQQICRAVADGSLTIDGDAVMGAALPEILGAAA